MELDPQAFEKQARDLPAVRATIRLIVTLHPDGAMSIEHPGDKTFALKLIDVARDAIKRQVPIIAAQDTGMVKT